MTPETPLTDQATVETAPDHKRIKSITVSGIRCNPGEAKVKGAPVKCAVILGFVYDVRETEDSRNPGTIYTALAGDFEAINVQAEPHETFRSGLLYLPSSFGYDAVEAFRRVKSEVEKQYPDGKIPKGSNFSSQLAYELFAVPAKNPAGYSYELRPLINETVADPLSTLRKAAAQKSNEIRAQLEAAKPKEIAPAPTPATPTPAPVEEQHKKGHKK